MIWWLWLIIGWVVVGGAVGLALWFETEGTFILGIILAIVMFVASLIVSVNAIDRHMTVQSCHSWSVQNNRPTKFASYTWWDFGCVTPDGHGHWIPTSQLIVNVPKPEGN